MPKTESPKPTATKSKKNYKNPTLNNYLYKKNFNNKWK